MKLLILGIVSLFYIIPALTQWSSEDCRGQWKNFWECVNTENGQFSDKRYLTQAENNRLNSDFHECFQGLGCGKAYDSRLISARRDCFNRYQGEALRYLQQCVRQRSQKPFELPQQANLNYFLEWHKNYVRRIAFERDFCPARVRSELGQCIDRKYQDATRQVRQTGDQCQNKKVVCGPKIHLECYKNWNSLIKPALRDCINSWNSYQREETQNAYSNCVADRTGSQYESFRDDDTHRKWFNYGSLINRFVDRTEPCAGSIY